MTKQITKTSPVPKKETDKKIVFDLTDDVKEIFKNINLNLVNLVQVLNKPAPTFKSVEPVTQEKKTVAKVTLSQIRELINERVSEGKTDSVIACLGKFEVKSASALKEENYSDFYADLKEC